MLITDPPYNVDYSGKTKDSLKIGNDNMSDSDFENFLQQSFRNADSVMKPGAAFYIWHSDSNGYIFRKACEEVGWKVRQCLIWNKQKLDGAGETGLSVEARAVFVRLEGRSCAFVDK